MSRKSIRARWLALEDDGTSLSSDVAEALDCSLSYVQYLRRQVEIACQARCSRCGFLHEEKIPVGDDGMCLWCRETVAGRDPRDLYESRAWMAEIDWRGNIEPVDRLREALRERMGRQSIVGAAAEMGMPANSLGNFLRGTARRPALQTLEKYAQYLDVPIEQVRAAVAR